MKGKKDTYWSNLKKVEQLLLHLLLFLLPTQLAYHFWPEWSFVFGIRVDYLAPAIYLTDILLLAILTLYFLRERVFPKYSLLVVGFSVINIAFSISPIASFLKWIKILEFFLFAYYVSQNKEFLLNKVTIQVISYSLLFFSLIGLAQFLTGRTLGGLFYLFGERSFNISTPGIALQSISGREFLRPYSTFSHPNSMAGFIGLSLIFFQKLTGAGKYLSALVFILAGSMGAYLAAIASYIFKSVSRVFITSVVVLSLVLPVVDSTVLAGEETVERFNLAKQAGEIISNNFFIGTGLNTFVVQNPLIQPVHNIFLLVLSETGIIGLLVLCWLMYKGFRKFPAAIIFVLVTGIFDHYWLTLHQNMLLLALVFGFVF